MAPLPLSFDIHTDLWGNHRVGDPSIPQIVGAFFTDMWGSHRGVSVPAAGGGISRRSGVYEQGFVSWSVAMFKMGRFCDLNCIPFYAVLELGWEIVGAWMVGGLCY